MTEIKILNPSQVYFYIENGISPLRVECGYNNKLVFIFEIESTRNVYGKWMSKDRVE